MDRSRAINQALGNRFAYVSWGKHVTSAGTRYGYAGYTHAGECQFLGRDFAKIVGLPSRNDCPNCGETLNDVNNGCPQCEIFECTVCEQWVSFTCGCEDERSDVCDDCWTELYEDYDQDGDY